MSTNLTRVIYLSSATTPFSKQDLRDLLELCRTRNAPKNITGLLLYRDGNFMQIIEGPENEVSALYQRIEVDRRHSTVIRVIKEDISERYFENWSMGFKDLEQETSECQDGFDNLINRPREAMSQRDFPRSVAAFVGTFLR
ncbi:MAG: BLUF domain-containing protein [Pseudomonadaceae bacterium]|nr:BLUF domain-containing protein [Pseudomonadaceae bacterium]